MSNVFYLLLMPKIRGPLVDPKTRIRWRRRWPELEGGALVPHFLLMRDPRIWDVMSRIWEETGNRDDYLFKCFEYVTRSVTYCTDTDCFSLPEYVQMPYEVLRSGMGDCLPYDTLLLRDDYSLVRICDIHVGDKIVGLTPSTKVIRKIEKGPIKMLNLKLNNGTTLRCSEDHILFCINEVGEKETLRAGEVRLGTELLSIKRNAGPRKIRVIAIEEGEIEIAYDIETEDSGIYLPENDIVVHNCDDAAILLTPMLYYKGIPSRFVMGYALGNSHRWVEAFWKGHWYVFDATTGDYFPLEEKPERGYESMFEVTPHSIRMTQFPFILPIFLP